jgi:hypothetical protein
MLNRFAEEPGNPSQFGFIGGIEGPNAWVQTALDTNITVVVLANFDPPAAEQVMLGLRKWLREHADALQQNGGRILRRQPNRQSNLTGALWTSAPVRSLFLPR